MWLPFRRSRADRFDEVLAQCLAAIEAGEASIESCLAAHPEHAGRLGPALRTAAGLRSSLAATPDPAFARRLRARVVGAASASRPVPRRAGAWRWAPRLQLSLRPALMAAAVLVVAVSAPLIAVTSAGALPGDWNYGVKLTTEDVLLTFGIKDHLDLADERARELRELAALGRLQDIPATTQAYKTEITEVQKPIIQGYLPPPPEARKIERRVAAQQANIQAAVQTVERQAQVQPSAPPPVVQEAKQASESALDAAVQARQQVGTAVITAEAQAQERASTTGTPTATTTPTPTGTPSPSATAEGSVTPTPSVTPSVTGTPGATGTAGAAVATQQAGSPTPSPTGTPTAPGRTPASATAEVSPRPGGTGTPAGSATAGPAGTPVQTVPPRPATAAPAPAVATVRPPTASTPVLPAPAAPGRLPAAPSPSPAGTGAATPATPTPASGPGTATAASAPTAPPTPVATEPPVLVLQPGEARLLYVGPALPIDQAMAPFAGRYAWVEWGLAGSPLYSEYAPGISTFRPLMMPGSVVIVAVTANIRLPVGVFQPLQ